MKVTRVRYTNGVLQDGIACEYPKAEVVHRNNDNWPGMGFIFRYQEWKDGKNEPEPGYQRLLMFGAEILMIDGPGNHYIVTGFVREDKWKADMKAEWVLERWYVGGHS